MKVRYFFSEIIMAYKIKFLMVSAAVADISR